MNNTKQKSGLKKIGKELAKEAEAGKKMVDKVKFPPAAKKMKK